MKTINYLIMVSAAILGVACNDIVESADVISIPEKEIILTATREHLDAGTKSFRLDDGSVWWSPKEEVSVFYGSGSNGGSKFVSMNNSIAETVELQGTIQMSGSGKEFWAVYPYSEDNSCDGTSITTIIPSQQIGIEGNFSNNRFPAMAKGSSTSLPFWNICGGIKFFVSREDIRSVTFKGNNNEPLAGKVKMIFDADGKPDVAEVLEGESEVTLFAPDEFFKVGKYYYITLLPTALQNGFSISFKTEYQKGTLKSNNQQAIKRSVFGVLKNIDAKVLEWEESTEPIAVDLGLSVKWANYNVGATRPWEYGDYFAFGEIEPYYEPGYAQSENPVWKPGKEAGYDLASYRWCEGSISTLKKYVISSDLGIVDNKTVLDLEDDAAHVNWGGEWRTPTMDEVQELLDECNYSLTSQNGVDGILFVSKKEGFTNKSIFVPLTGARGWKGINYFGDQGWLWTSSVGNWSSVESIGYPYCIFMNANDKDNLFVNVNSGSQFYGFVIRPVCGNTPVPVSDILLSDSELVLYEKQSHQLSATVYPSNATFPRITWTSTNSAVAFVSEFGRITTREVGTATITAISSDGKKQASCKVTVVLEPTREVVPYVVNNTKSSSGLEITEGLVFNVNGEKKALEWLEKSGELGVVSNRSDYYACGYPADAVAIDGRTADITFPQNIDCTQDLCCLGGREEDSNSIVHVGLVPASALLTFTLNGSLSGSNVDWGRIELSSPNSSLSGMVRYNISNLDEFSISNSNNSVIITRNYNHDYSDGIFIPIPPQEFSGLSLTVYDSNDRILDSKETSKSFTFLRGLRYSLGSITIKEDHSVTDAVSKPDDAYVNITEATVAALYSGGFIATDGNSNINVFLKATPDVKIGDKVSIKATKSTDYGLPKLNKPSVSVLSSGNEVPRTELKNITSIIDSYDASVAEYIYVIGKLVKDGNNWNVEMQGASRKATASSLHSSIDPSALEGKQVVMKGYFNTIYQSKNLLQIVVAEIVDAEPEAVDLGLPSGLKWATMNVGATKPEEYGEYFAWGETEPKSDYRWSTYKWCNGAQDKLTKYCTLSSYWDSTEPMDNKTALDPEDDAAHVNWGGSWRMPTDEECEELINNCTWTWTTQNGVNGRLVTGPNGNSIFLPAAGSRDSAGLYNVASGGSFWSSSLRTDRPYDAWVVYFGSGNVDRRYYRRYYGPSVRPVSE